MTFTTTCPLDSGIEASAGDAADDAADADDGAAPDGGGLPCFASCTEACSALKPANLAGEGLCDFADAGASGVVVAHCKAQIFCMGRKFDGLDAPLVDGASHAAKLAQMAWLEAASVHAFRRLARELAAHGAPSELVAAAKACARDEIRHARMMTKLARRHGAKVPPVTAARVPIRDLESIARENAVEGCVGETFGALQAMWRAAREADAELADAMRAIAPDELRHAALGWAVAAWLDTRLDDVARARVRRARSKAARDLVAQAPSEEERALAAGLHRELWAA